MIAFLGDSIVKGTDYGVAAEDTFAAILGGASHINAGVGSNTTADARARISDVYGAATCYIMLGINDWRTGVTASQMRDDLGWIVGQLKSRHCDPIILTTVLYRGSLAQIRSQEVYANACYGLGAPVVDIWREFIVRGLVAKDHYPLYADEVHLSTAGHRHVADFVQSSGVAS